MELEELKSTWKLVGPQIDKVLNLECKNLSEKEKSDAKTKVLRRVLIGAFFSLTGFVLMTTSWLWAPVKLHVIWLSAISAVIFIGLLSEIYLARMIYKINLWENTHYEVFTCIIRIKKLYKRMELYMSVLALLVIGSLSFLQSFQNSMSITWILGLLLLSFALEYIWYRRNVRYLDEMCKSDEPE